MERIFSTSEFARSSKFKSDFVKKNNSKKEWNRLIKGYDDFLFFKKSKNYKLFPNKIPKKIHQIWIGPKKIPYKYKIWAETWKKCNPEWEYILWDEKMINDFCLKNQEVYQANKNPGLKSDIARYEILNRFGGLYVDTDFECLKKIPDFFLKYEFVSSIGFDYYPTILNGMFLSVPNSIILKKLINSINTNSINMLNEKNDPYEIMRITGPYAFTKTIMSLDLEAKNKYLILPSNIFYPYPNFMISSKIKKKDFITDESIAIHHWGMSWMKKNKLLQIIKVINNKIKLFKI